MKKILMTAALLGSVDGYSQEVAKRNSSVEFDLRNPQYSSFLSSYFISGSMLDNGYLPQIGIGLGDTRYEVNRSRKAMGLKSAITFQAKKEIISSLSLSQGAFVGYESVNFGNKGYDWEFSAPGFAFYGMDFGLTFQDRGSPIMLTTGVSLSAQDFSSKKLRTKFDDAGLGYPTSSVSPFIKVGVAL